ncbi:MAG: PilZ domain-containing protein [Myxococcaceae bacterium]|nr:PilZ domain-containing protein [Myxococcaceae bacterium]
MNKRPGYTQARSHTRVPASFPVRVVNAAALRLADEARDVSEAGVGVSTSSPLPPMTLVPLRLDLPTSTEPIEVLGRVMWSTSSAMGLRFEQPDERIHTGVARLRAALERL